MGVEEVLCGFPVAHGGSGGGIPIHCIINVRDSQTNKCSVRRQRKKGAGPETAPLVVDLVG